MVKKDKNQLRVSAVIKLSLSFFVTSKKKEVLKLALIFCSLFDYLYTE
jgi:hypothetical protein